MEEVFSSTGNRLFADNSSYIVAHHNVCLRITYRTSKVSEVDEHFATIDSLLFIESMALY